MNKKGFTLIELLAVIVILAVIALIATPIILNVIEDSRVGSFKDSVFGVVESVELDIVKNEMNDENFKFPYVFTLSNTDTLEYKGKKFTSGTVIIDEGVVYAQNMTDGVYCATGRIDDLDVSKNCNKIVFKDVYKNWDMFYGIGYDNKLYSWGVNITDNDEYEYIANPKPILPDETIKDISVCSEKVIVLTESGKVYNWGTDWSGELGRNSEALYEFYKIEEISLPITVTKVKMKYDKSYIFADNGDIYVAGENERGETGIGYAGANITTFTKSEKLSGMNFVDIESARDHAIALTSSGELYGWGRNNTTYKMVSSQLPNAIIVNPTKITPPSDSKVVQIATNMYTSYFLLENGEVYAFGSNQEGFYGIGNTDLQSGVIKKVPLDEKIVKISAYASYIVVLSESGKLYGWGHNTDASDRYPGSLMLLGVQVVPSPIRLLEDLEFADVSTNSAGGIAKEKNGTFWNWGRWYEPSFDSESVLSTAPTPFTYKKLWEPGDVIKYNEI